MARIPEKRGERKPDVLALARSLIKAGNPVFAGKLDKDGNPDVHHDSRWKAWEQTRASYAALQSYRPGDALCMVTGVRFDVLDLDPRNGGRESLKKLSAELGDNGPVIYMEVDTPSGGRHFYIAPLGIGTRLNFLPGLDLKGGKADGSSRGFVFLPGTERPSKWGQYKDHVRPYTVREALTPVNGSGPCEAFRTAVESHAAEGDGRVLEGKVVGPARSDNADLREACKQAEAGEQRMALLRYVHELEKLGYRQDDIVRLCESLKITNFDARKPWRESDFRGLLHKPGEVIGDALPGELDGLDGRGEVEVRPKGILVRRADEFTRRMVVWVWSQFIGRGLLTVVDGSKSQGKSTFVSFLAALGSSGRSMPDGAGRTAPLRFLIFTREDRPEIALVPRLEAHGADLTNVFFHVVPPRPVKRRGEKEQSDPWELPGGAVNFAEAIRQAGADVAVFDPIADFYDEKVQTHNDASLRRAVSPLAVILAELNCAGIAIRHQNQDKSQDARFRGSGAGGLQNIGRIHLVTGELPPLPPAECGGSERRRFAIQQVDVNYTVLNDQALSYIIVDSDIPLDEEGQMIGRIETTGWVKITPNELTRGQETKRGPEAIETELLMSFLRERFSGRDTWKVADLVVAAEETDLSTRQATMEEARKRLGKGADPLVIHKKAVYKKAGGVDYWTWTTLEPKFRRNG